MYGPGWPVFGTFSLPRSTASAGVAIFTVIPPFRGESGWAMQQWTVGSQGSARQKGVNNQGRRTHVSKVIYSTGATAHLVSILRPLNFTVLAAAAAANATVIALQDDPGIFSTNFKYGNSAPAQAADRAIGANDYIVTQLNDGTWKASVVASGAYGALTLAGALPNNGVGAAQGNLCYLMGGPTDVDPSTGGVQPSSQIAASAVRDASWADDNYGVCASLHDGDPMLFLSPNATNAGFLESLCGFYSDR